MKLAHFSKFWWVLSLFVLFSYPALAKDKDKLALVPIRDLHPTQFDVGMKEVEIRARKIHVLLSDPKSLKKLLKKEPSLVVIGPGGKRYMIDGHHFTRAAHEEHLESIYVEIVKDWSDRSEADFWSKMKEKGWVYLRHAGGSEQPPRNLPAHISELSDDPYRSLAWMLRKAGGYSDEEMPFREFIWADYLRSRVKADFSTEASAMESLNEALKISQTREAADLPGYLPGQVTMTPKCLLDTFSALIR